MAERLRALQVGVDLGLDFADDRQAAVNFGDDAVSLGHPIIVHDVAVVPEVLDDAGRVPVLL